MNKLFWICIVLSSAVFGQINLVPNWSFEDYYSCPTNSSYDCENTAPVIPPLKDWFCALTYASTPDYFNVCGGSLVDVPNNFFGHQTAKTGNGYLGGFMHRMNNPMINNSEYIECKLKDSLKPNITYCMRYYVSRAEMPNYASSNFGALFTTTVINISGLPNYINQVPQVQNPLGNFIADKINWTKIEGSFTAVGGETYLTLGSFGSASINDSLFVPDSINDTRKIYFRPYYYLDDVSVEAVANAQAGADQIIYSGDAVVIGGDSAVGADYLWTPNIGLNYDTVAFPIASPTITTQYVLQKKQCSVITYDTVLVTVSPVGINELFINNSVNILPNPTTDVINISSTYDLRKIELINVAGQVLLSGHATEKEHQLQLQNFAEGIYFVRIYFCSGLNVTRKIVVNR